MVGGVHGNSAGIKEDLYPKEECGYQETSPCSVQSPLKKNFQDSQRKTYPTEECWYQERPPCSVQPPLKKSYPYSQNPGGLVSRNISLLGSAAPEKKLPGQSKSVPPGGAGIKRDLIAASTYDKHSVGPSIRPDVVLQCLI